MGGAHISEPINGTDSDLQQSSILLILSTLWQQGQPESGACRGKNVVFPAPMLALR
ncbi:uncharacterized protein METZ01_LOCUS485763, partial [marine metagenome]